MVGCGLDGGGFADLRRWAAAGHWSSAPAPGVETGEVACAVGFAAGEVVAPALRAAVVGEVVADRFSVSDPDIGRSSVSEVISSSSRTAGRAFEISRDRDGCRALVVARTRCRSIAGAG